MVRRKGSRTCSPGAAALLLGWTLAAACATRVDDTSVPREPPAGQLSVFPSGVVGATEGATIRHSLATTLAVSATNEDGVCQTMEVPPNHAVSWSPPPGWRSVTFSAPGVAAVLCVIDPSL